MRIKSANIMRLKEIKFELKTHDTVILYSDIVFVTEEKKSLSYGNINGLSVVSPSTECKPIPSLFDRDNVDVGTSNIATAEDDSPPLRPKKVIVYSKKTNVDIENGGALMQISDDKWAAYSYSHLDD